MPLEKKLHIRRCDEGEPLCIVFLKPALSISEEISQRGFLEENEDDLKRNEDEEDDNDMPDLELVSRQLGPDVLGQFELKSGHTLPVGRLSPFGLDGSVNTLHSLVNRDLAQDRQRKIS